MNIKLLSIIKYALLLAIAVTLLLLAFRGMDIKKIMKGIVSANMFWIAVSGFISIVAFAVRAHRWNLLIEPMGHTPSLKNTTYSVMIGYLANFFVPRLGEVSRCASLSKAESIPFNKLFGTVIIERIIDVISLLGCIILAAILEYKRLGNFFTENIFDPVISKFQQITNSPLLLAVVVVVVIGLIIGAVYFARKNKRKTADSKFSKLVKGFIDGLRSVANLKRPGLFIFESVFIWVLYYLGVYVALFAFPYTSELGGGGALFLLVAGGIGMSTPVQGGIGAYHLFVSQGLVLYGVAKENGLVFATMLHGLQFILVIILGIASLLLLFWKRKENLAPGVPKS